MYFSHATAVLFQTASCVTIVVEVGLHYPLLVLIKRFVYLNKAIHSIKTAKLKSIVTSGVTGKILAFSNAILDIRHKGRLQMIDKFDC